MKKYSTYKDSGIEWIGEIPSHWKATRMKFLGDALGGVTYNPDDIVESSQEGVLVLRSSNIQNGKLSLDDCVYINMDIPDKKVVQKGDILICSRNGSQRLIGKNICIDERTAGETFGAFMMVFRSEYWNFLSHFFNSPIFKSQSGLFLTSTINQLTSGTLNNFFVAIPESKKEQTQIANYLDHKTQQIDDLIAKKERLIELLEEERTALINQTVTKGLDPNVPIKDSGFDWLGMIPKDWATKKLRFLALIIPSNIDKKSKEGEKRVQLCNYTDVYKNDFISYDENFMWASASDTQIQKLTLKANDVIVTKDSEDPSDIGVPALVLEDMNNVVCGYHLTVFRENQNNGFGRYLYWFLKSTYCSDYFNLKARGITRYALGTNAFKELHVPTPKNVSEYGKIADFLERKTSGIAETILKIEQEIELIKEYKTTLISEVVTGKIDVREEILIEQL